MFYIINLQDFIVIRGPFMNYEQAMNVKTALAMKIPRELMAIVVVQDKDWI